MPLVVLRTVIGAPVAECFRLALSVDAHTQSMGGSGERAVAGVTSGVMGPGDTVTWQATHFGVPFRMTSEITEHDEPRRFVDEQQRGPFGSWWHEHTFADHGDGTTVMVDTVRFRSPLGPVGTAVDRLVLGRYMTRLLERRNRWLRTTLEDAA